MAKIIVGVRVRVKDPDRYISEVRNKVRNRVGTVQDVWEPQAISRGEPRVKVLFDPRRKGSPSYVEVFRPSALEVVDG